MNLLGPELLRDLVSLIQLVEADDAYRVLVFKSCRMLWSENHPAIPSPQMKAMEMAFLAGCAVAEADATFFSRLFFGGVSVWNTLG